METSELFSPGRKKARIEIIPLIDVVFFLLATFVLFTLSLDKIASLNVQLPKVPPGDTRPDETMVFIQASDSGTMYWKQGERSTPELITAAELPARLSEYRNRVPKPRVLIRGDNKAHFGAAAQILDEVRLAGIHEVSVETMPSRTGT